MVQNHRRQTTNPTQTQHTNTQTERKPQQRTQAGRPWASRPPPCNREAALDQLVQRQFLPGLPSLRRGTLAEPTEAPKTQPNDDEQQTQQPNPNPDKTKPRTNTPHTPQIAEALYAGASWECNAKDSPLDFQSPPGSPSLCRGSLARPLSFSIYF